MGIVERLQREAPKNEEVVKLCRTRRGFEQETGRYLTPAKKRLLQSGAFDIIKDLLQNVEGSSFGYIDSEFRYPGVFLYLRRNEVTLKFRWDTSNELGEPSDVDGADLLGRSRFLDDKSLEVTAKADSTSLQVRSASNSMITFVGQRDLLPPLSVDYYNVSLVESEWRDNNKFMGVIVEALSLGGFTKRDLNRYE